MQKTTDLLIVSNEKFVSKHIKVWMPIKGLNKDFSEFVYGKQKFELKRSKISRQMNH